jgi:hypothetical protein
MSVDIITRGKQGRIQDFKLGGMHLKKLRRAEGGANFFGVFRVKNHNFMPKKSYFKSKSDHQYINGVDSNPAKGRTKKMSAKNLTLPLLRRFYKKKYLLQPGILSGSHGGRCIT